MAITIHSSIKLNEHDEDQTREVKITSPEKLSALIQTLAEGTEFRGERFDFFQSNIKAVTEQYQLPPASRNSLIPIFLFFSWIGLLALKLSEGKASSPHQDMDKLVDEIASLNGKVYKKEVKNIRDNKEAFHAFYDKMSYRQKSLLSSWVEIFSDVDADMNTIRELAEGSRNGHEKVITKEKLQPIGVVSTTRLVTA